MKTDLAQVLAFRDLASEHGVFFYYSGFFSQAIIEGSADAIDQRMEAAGVPEKARRKVLAAFIEMAQNIVHYSAERLTAADAVTDEVRMGAILIAQRGEGVELSCSNPVERETWLRLEPKVEAISRMSLEAIRAAYREALRAEGEAESKGGGLGLLTLARGSVNPLEYSFTPHPATPELVNFQLHITV